MILAFVTVKVLLVVRQAARLLEGSGATWLLANVWIEARVQVNMVFQVLWQGKLPLAVLAYVLFDLLVCCLMSLHSKL